MLDEMKTKLNEDELRQAYETTDSILGLALAGIKPGDLEGGARGETLGNEYGAFYEALLHRVVDAITLVKWRRTEGPS